MAVAGQHGGGGLRAPAGNAREAVGAVPDQGQVVGDAGGPHAELRHHPILVAHLVLPPVPLHDPPAHDTLRQVLVRSADVHAFHPGVAGRPRRPRRQPVIGLQLFHGPDLYPHRPQRVLEGVELGQKVGVDAVARLVAGPEVVAEGLDDVVRGDGHVGRAALQHAEKRGQHAAQTAHGSPGGVQGRGRAEVVAEELVGAVDEVDVQGGETCAGGRWRWLARGRSARYYDRWQEHKPVAGTSRSRRAASQATGET